jgi:pyruvate kinase
MQIDFEKKSINSLFDDVAVKALEAGVVNTGDLMVFTGGTPLGTTGSTNTIKVGIVGDILLQGKSMVKSTKVTAHTNIITTVDEAKLHFRKNDIFVTSNPDKGLIPYMMRAAAIVVGSNKNYDFTHAVDLGRELKIPVILCDGKDVATAIPDTILVTIDSNKGTVLIGER